MTFNNLYKTLLKNRSNINYITELLENPKNRYQEALFILFSALNLNDRIDVDNERAGAFRLGLDDFNVGEIYPISLAELAKHNIKSGGSAADCVFLKRNQNDPWEIICISAKDYENEIGFKNFEISDISVNLKKYYQSYLQQKVGIICRDKNLIRIPNKTSQLYREIIDSNLVFDNNDLIRWWKEKFCVRTLPKSLQEIIRLEREQFELRLHQDFTVSKTKAIVEYDPISPVLWGHIPRSGKSFMIAALIRDCVIHKYDDKLLFVIVCAIPNETKPQYEDIFKTYVGFEQINIINVTKTAKPKLTRKKKTVLLFSRQFFTNKKQKGELEWLRNLKFKYLFIDEAHYGSATDLASDIFDYFFPSTTKIYITATYCKPSAKFNIAKERAMLWRIEDVKHCQNIHEREHREALLKFHDASGALFFANSLAKQVREKGSYEKIEEVYKKFPALELITWRLDKNYKKYLTNYDENGVSQTQGWSLAALFNKNKKNHSFENPADIIDVFSRIFGTGSQIANPNAFLRRCKKIVKNKYSTQSPPLLTRWFDTKSPKLILCYLPTHMSNVLGIRDLSKTLKKLLEENSVCPGFYIKCVNSQTNLSATRSVREAKRFAKNRTDIKGIILLLGRQLQMGVSLPKADFVIMLDNSDSFDNIYQKIFRCITEDDGKKVGFCIDLNIQRTIDFAFNDYEAIKAREFASEKGNVHTFKIDTTRFKSNLININSDQYNKEENLGCDVIDLKAMIEVMNAIYAHSIFNSAAVSRGYCGPLQSFFKKNNLFIQNGKGSQLLEFFETLFKTNVNTKVRGFISSISSSDSDVPTGLSKEEEAEKNNLEHLAIGDDGVGDEKKKTKVKKVQFTRDIFTPLVMLMCLLTIREDGLDNFQDMSIFINQRAEYKQHLLKQINLWWSSKIKQQFNGSLKFMDLVDLYKRHFSDEDFNKWIYCYKHQLVDLHHIDKQTELSRIIDETFKPSAYEKQNFAAIMTPRNLRQKILDLMPEEFWRNPNNTVFEPCCGRGGFVIDIVGRFMDGLQTVIPDRKARYRHIVEKQIYFADIIEINIWLTKMLLDPVGKQYKLNYFLGNSLQLNVHNYWTIRHFDAVITNPPFNDSSGGQGGCGHEVWPQFIGKFIEWIKEYSGLLLAVCPNKWRHINKINVIADVKREIRTFWIRKIVFCDANQGQKYFKCRVMFDYFILQKVKQQKLSKITDFQGTEYVMNISEYQVIPNFNIIKHYELLDFSNDKQKKINFIYSSGSYDLRKTKINKKAGEEKPLLANQKSLKYRYPVMLRLNKVKKNVVYWTHDNTKKTYNGKLFTVPKVVFTQGSGMEMAIIDFDGKYLLTEFAYGINSNDANELKKIQRAIRNPKFGDFVNATSSSFILNMQIFKCLKRDFYLSFI